MRILLLVTAFNGLSQRVWCELRAAGHQVGVLFATSERDIVDGAGATAPDLILCPFLKDRVPAVVWQRWRTVIIHPGPVGDRGPSSLDWAITESAPRWGVTALQAVEKMDAGPIWATRTFVMPDPPMRKSALYNGPVADAALECVREVVAKAADPSFMPIDQDHAPIEIPGARTRPSMTQADRRVGWPDTTDRIVRAARAADGTPGLRITLAGADFHVFDAYPGEGLAGAPGRILDRRAGFVQVATGDGSVWLGRLRPVAGSGEPVIKLPAARLLPGAQARGQDVPGSPREITYRRDGQVGWLTFAVYNGAMSTALCRRLDEAVRHAASQDTRVLVVRSGTEVFSNGIDLNTIHAAEDPAGEAWANIEAINQVCKRIIAAGQFVIAGYAGSAGAGGVMLGLGADLVAARAGIVFNPYYDIGLYGSELHTYTLPARVGDEQALRLLTDKLPILAEQAATIGLVDEIGPREPAAWDRWLTALAHRHGSGHVPRRARWHGTRHETGDRLPVGVHEVRELAQMSRDMFEDRSGFAAARHAFVAKTRTRTPERLRQHQ